MKKHNYAYVSVTNHEQELVSYYAVPYKEGKELDDIYQRERENHSSMFVTMEANGNKWSYNRTWAEEFNMQEMQWDFMNGDYGED